MGLLGYNTCCYRYDDGTSLTTDDVMEEANVFVFEGHDTTASGISKFLSTIKI